MADTETKAASSPDEEDDQTFNPNSVEPEFQREDYDWEVDKKTKQVTGTYNKDKAAANEKARVAKMSPEDQAANKRMQADIDAEVARQAAAKRAKALYKTSPMTGAAP